MSTEDLNSRRNGFCAALAMTFAACSPIYADPLSAPSALEFVGSWEIYSEDEDFKEPSGLAFEPKSKRLIAISDNNGRLYYVDETADTIETAGIVDHLKDPEGVVYDTSGNRLLVLSEDQAAIYDFPMDNLEKAEKHSLDDLVKSASPDVRDWLQDNFSPEGITVQTTTGNVLVVNERSPRVLVEISSDLSQILSVVELSASKGFSANGVKDHHLDASGLAFDDARQALWIVSDTGHSAFFWKPEQGPALRFDLLWTDGEAIRPIKNAEGVAVSEFGDQLYIVNDNDKHSRLFVYAVR